MEFLLDVIDSGGLTFNGLQLHFLLIRCKTYT